MASAWGQFVARQVVIGDHHQHAQFAGGAYAFHGGLCRYPPFTIKSGSGPSSCKRNK